MALVCVTGGCGYFASCLIEVLLERGYTVRATARDPGNLKKTAHLWNLQHATERLQLFKADLLDDGSFCTAVEGCEGVFHVASPFKFIVDNPEEELIIPAVKGTLNVLNTCAASKSVRRVVLTSSMATVTTQALDKLSSIVVDENCWSDPHYCEEYNLWYDLSKLIAEQRAWEFAKEKNLDLVVLNPALIVGKPLQEGLDAGTQIVQDILTGRDSPFMECPLTWVDVRDVAEAHILAFEVPTASSRYVCAERVMDCRTLLEVFQKIVPGYTLPQKFVDKPLLPATMFKMSTQKLQGLGLTLRPIEDALLEIYNFLLERGLLPQ